MLVILQARQFSLAEILIIGLFLRINTVTKDFIMSVIKHSAPTGHCAVSVLSKQSVEFNHKVRQSLSWLPDFQEAKVRRFCKVIYLPFSDIIRIGEMS